ncbi:MAG TPA: prepilin-type N-terminal cleavage/methylation domain-containing protein [Nannocystis exedens]|nr:prepilin-type N-terminal cleavage/methylation domain-containing protein [Nannocystis exedens]
MTKVQIIQSIVTRRLKGSVKGADRGMTLIEILVVLAIISLILGGVGVMAFGRLDAAKIKTCTNQVTQIQGHSEIYMLEKNGKCPKDVADLKAAGVVNKVSKDPWGNDYIITCPGAKGDKVDVLSWGPDGSQGGGDDISTLDSDSDKKGN